MGDRIGMVHSTMSKFDKIGAGPSRLAVIDAMLKLGYSITLFLRYCEKSPGGAAAYVMVS